MKREILFRGKRIDNGGWVQGYYFYHVGKDNHVILCNDRFIQVDPDTVGQFTGLTDKNGVKIFEGDVLKKWETDYDEWEKLDYEGEEPFKSTKKDVATMERFPCFWMVNEQFGYEGDDLEDQKHWEIIGNIHDNPELL